MMDGISDFAAQPTRREVEWCWEAFGMYYISMRYTISSAYSAMNSMYNSCQRIKWRLENVYSLRTMDIRHYGQDPCW